MIIVNGYAFATEEIANQVEKVLWKQTHDADLNTVDGCRQASAALASFLANISPDYHPGGHHPSSLVTLRQDVVLEPDWRPDEPS